MRLAQIPLPKARLAVSSIGKRRCLGMAFFTDIRATTHVRTAGNENSAKVVTQDHAAMMANRKVAVRHRQIKPVRVENYTTKEE